MIKTRLSEHEINTIREMRMRACTITEILKVVRRSRSIVFNYMQKVEVPDEFQKMLEQKKCGTKVNSQKYWNLSKTEAQKYSQNLTDREKILILASVYWGEGRKSNEFSIINSDPYIILVTLEGLKLLGVGIEDIKISLRIFDDLDIRAVTYFWSNFLGIDSALFGNPEIVTGKENGKLKYGMCRLRISRGQRYFKLMVSMIDLIKQQYKVPMLP